MDNHFHDHTADAFRYALMVPCRLRRWQRFKNKLWLWKMRCKTFFRNPKLAWLMLRWTMKNYWKIHQMQRQMREYGFETRTTCMRCNKRKDYWDLTSPLCYHCNLWIELDRQVGAPIFFSDCSKMLQEFKNYEYHIAIDYGYSHKNS